MNAPDPDHGQLSLLARWHPHLTFRTRLTLTFTALVAIAGALTVVIVTVFMRTVPIYSLPITIADHSTESTAPIAPETGGDANEMAQATAIMLRTPSEILNTTLVVSLLALVVVIAGGALIAWIVAGRMLRPLKAVNAAAQLAGTGSFDHRIGLNGPRDEVRDLADTFDTMLERLDHSFTTTQRFAANASHELRTPLATTQTMLEVALSDPAIPTAELRAVAERVLETNRRGIETVDALLDLAELDVSSIDPREVNLTSLTRAAVREEAASISAARLTVIDELPASALIHGDGVLLRQAVLNLVRNAVRHNVPDGMIRLTSHPRDNAVVLSVENSGAEFTDTLVATLNEPFVRGAGRITEHGPRGTGLGLAIVESIMRAHDGTLRLRRRDGGGLRAEIELPSAGVLRSEATMIDTHAFALREHRPVR